MIIHCPRCNEPLELPDEAIGRKVQCVCCEEKFFATEDFIHDLEEPAFSLQSPAVAPSAAENPRGEVKNEGLDLRARAEGGDDQAQYELAMQLLNGDGAATNGAEGFKWCRRSAERGNERAQYALGVCLFNGLGAEVDFEQSIFWFMRAAERGSADAMFNIGICHGNGLGFKKNVVEAMKWFRKAAEIGDEASKRIVAQGVYTGKATMRTIP